MNQVNKAELESLVKWLNEQAGNAVEQYTKNADGVYKANVGNYHLDWAYGGVRLNKMENDGGGVSTPLGGGFNTKREMAAKLRAFISGIEIGKK